MADDIATTLENLLNRAVRQSIDIIAKEGLELLKQVLDQSGFATSPYLKNYSIYAHVIGDVIEYEIIVSLNDLDDESLEEIESSEDVEDKTPDRSYGVVRGLIGRMYSLDDARRDARTPARDARKTLTSGITRASDARKTSSTRSLLSQSRNTAPRSIHVNRDGKLSVRLKNYIQQRKSEVVIPTQKYHGIVAEFMGSLETVVSQTFAPRLATIVSQRLG